MSSGEFSGGDAPFNVPSLPRLSLVDKLVAGILLVFFGKFVANVGEGLVLSGKILRAYAVPSVACASVPEKRINGEELFHALRMMEIL
jgi:hypothetical protein